jgi:molybdopterin-guanine dinucleotide biosynthesis protein A
MTGTRVGGAVSTAGFVLAGGKSSRMGRDKALLPWHGRTLVEEVAERVFRAAGSVTLVGTRSRYGHLGLPVLEDLVPGNGPLGGLFTALENTSADWNLLVACDMPGITDDFLRGLIHAARSSDGLALVPNSTHGWEPLCAVYHRDLKRHVYSALIRKALKMQDFVANIAARPWPVSDPSLLANVNTLEDWQETQVHP